MSINVELKEVGVIHTPYNKLSDCPIQPSRSQDVAEVEVFEEYKEGLLDLDGFSHIILLFLFHRSDGYSLKVKPFLDNHLRGLFATRAPRRPNPIGLSVVRLIEIRDNILKIKGIDVLNETPLIDIKPYVFEFDRKEDVKVGWLTEKI